MRQGDEVAGRYRLDELQGRGPMSEVWRAHDRTLDRTVALKILSPTHHDCRSHDGPADDDDHPAHDHHASHDRADDERDRDDDRRYRDDVTGAIGLEESVYA